MIITHFNPDLKIQSQSYAWRYMDFDKIWDLLTTNSVYFSRLDTFHDPIEGLSLFDRASLQSLNVINCEESRQNFLRLCTEESKENIKRNINNWQQGIFGSCWYLTELDLENDKFSTHHELIAMWNFISGNNGFVLKINFHLLLTLISESLNSFIDTEISRSYFGKVYYLNYEEHLRLRNNSDGDILPSLIKHNSYSFENEIRFLLLRKNLVDAKNNRRGIKLPLQEKLDSKKHEIEIIAHPNMSEKAFKSFRKKFATLGFDLKVSSILTKQRIAKLLKKNYSG